MACPALHQRFSIFDSTSELFANQIVSVVGYFAENSLRNRQSRGDHTFVSIEARGNTEIKERMSDSIKFGPEWLRNMSSDTGGLSATTASSGGTSNSSSYTSTYSTQRAHSTLPFCCGDFERLFHDYFGASVTIKMGNDRPAACVRAYVES